MTADRRYSLNWWQIEIKCILVLTNWVKTYHIFKHLRFQIWHVSHSNIFQNIPFFIEFPGCRPMFLRMAVNKLLAHFVPKWNSTVIFPLFLLRNVGCRRSSCTNILKSGFYKFLANSPTRWVFLCNKIISNIAKSYQIFNFPWL